MELYVKILIIEEDAFTTMVLERVLKNNFEKVYSISDPSVAIEVINEIRPSVIILDGKMDKIEGLDLALTIVEKYDIPPRIIFNTGGYDYLKEYLNKMRSCNKLKNATLGVSLKNYKIVEDIILKYRDSQYKEKLCFLEEA